MLLGRGAEQQRVDALLALAQGGTSGALVIRGDPGIGKTALLRYAVDRCHDMTVLSATGMETEAELAFSGLSELLHPVLDLLDEIPSPQTRALAGALAVGPPDTQDRFTISVATLSLLAAAAERRPVLVIIDDAHWLDEPSRGPLLFAARRLQADRIVMLFTVRLGDRVTFDAPALPDLTLPGVDVDACAALLSRAGAAHVSRAVARKILEATAGNPLAILETPRVLSRDQLSGREPLSEPVPLGPAVQRSFARRVAHLPSATQTALLVAAASQSRSTDEVHRACDRLGIDYSALEAAESDGLIDNDGIGMRFRHPLIRATVYHGAPAPARRAAHRVLAEALADGSSASQRAWHLAAATDGADEQVAAALERAGREARERSGHASAARAFERAARLTPDPEQGARRLLEAGVDAHVAGESGRSLDLLREALPHATEVVMVADIEHAVSRVEMWAGSSVAARAMLLSAADRIERWDPGRAALMLVDAVSTCFHHGDPDQGAMRPALAIARRAYALGAEAGGIARTAASGALGASLILLGEADEARPLLMEGKRALDDTESLALVAQLIEMVVPFLWLEEYDLALGSLEQVVARARARSAPGALAYALCRLAEAERRVGRWTLAYASAGEAVQLAMELGLTATPMLGFALMCLAWVEAGLGRERDCREHAAAALATSNPPGTTIDAFVASVLGLLALGLGRGGEAVTHLRHVAQLCDREHFVEPTVFMYTPDLIEAYVLTGARAEAEAVLDTFEALAARTRRNWAQATAARCRGMLADGDFDAPFNEALSLHLRTPTPFDRARTELCYGERLRRAKRRRESRIQLRSALETFERLGAEPWAERARNELLATGLTARRRDRSGSERLTAQELRVALEVATGATNREVAAALFLSPKTVEAHLGRIYSKLGLRSRAQLANSFRRDTGGRSPM
jgi:DNA-binding CsgD family transcriptional regulator